MAGRVRAASSATTSDAMKQRGAIDLVLVLLISAFAGGLLCGPAIKAKLAGKPPTAALEQATAKAHEAEQALAAAQHQEQARKDALVQSAQQMVDGAQRANDRAPDSPEKHLTASLLSRADLSLALAIGELPRDKQVEIAGIVDGMLSKVEAERAEALRKLEAKDVEVQQIAKERDRIKAEIPRLEDAKAKAETTAQAKQAEVIRYADAAKAEQERASSFEAQVWHWLKIGAGLYLLVHFVLPSVAQQYPQIGFLKHANDTIKSLTSAHL